MLTRPPCPEASAERTGGALSLSGWLALSWGLVCREKPQVDEGPGKVPDQGQPDPSPEHLSGAPTAPHLQGPQRNLRKNCWALKLVPGILLLPLLYCLPWHPLPQHFFYTKLSLNSPDFSHLLYILYGNGEIITASPAG